MSEQPTEEEAVYDINVEVTAVLGVATLLVNQLLKLPTAWAIAHQLELPAGLTGLSESAKQSRLVLDHIKASHHQNDRS